MHIGQTCQGFAWLSFLPYIIGAVVIGGAVWTIWSSVNNWCNGACRDAREERDEAIAESVQLHGVIKAAQERATALALLWSEAINKVEVRYVQVERDRRAAFAGVRERAGSIRVDTSRVLVPVTAPVIGVLRDAERAANGGSPAAPREGEGSPAPVPETARDTTLAEWVQFAIDAAEAYREAYDKWQAAVQAYESVREASGKITQAESL
jgi:hypothetical protein